MYQRPPQPAAVPPASFSKTAPDPLNRLAFADTATETSVVALEAAAADAKVSAAALTNSKERRAAQKLARAAQRRAIDARRALEAERQAEDMCPAAQRLSWAVQPLQDSAGSLVGYRRSSVLRTIQKKSTIITERLVAAGEAYATAAEAAEAGIIKSCSAPMAGGGVSCSGNAAIENSVGSGAQLLSMRNAVGIFCTGILDHVALENRGIADWAREKGVNERVAIGMLYCALDRLAEHLCY